MRYFKIIVVVLFLLSVILFGCSMCGKLIKSKDTPPVITGDNTPLQVKCDYAEEELLEGLTATDKQDGDITENIIVGNISRFYNGNTCKVTLVVFDSANQPDTFEREVTFTDYQPPRIQLTKPLVFTVGNYEDVKKYIVAEDVLDGDITSMVAIQDSNVNFSVAGDYAVKVEVTNSFGDVCELVLPVHIVEHADAQYTIQLKEQIVYLNVGDTFHPEAYVERVTAIDGRNGDASLIQASSKVDTKTAGCYEIEYSYADANHHQGYTWMTVVVK